MDPSKGTKSADYFIGFHQVSPILNRKNVWGESKDFISIIRGIIVNRWVDRILSRKINLKRKVSCKMYLLLKYVEYSYWILFSYRFPIYI